MKASQLVAGKRIYLHPQLLLEGTELAIKISGQKLTADQTDVRQVILNGRWISAILGGLAVVAFGLIGYCYGGFAGFFLAALSVGLCPSILLNAHFMKEDTALLLGVATSLLGALFYSKAVARAVPALPLVFLGIAAGLAVSGKYIGIVMLIAALAFISFPWRWPNALLRCGGLLLAFTLTTVLINLSIFFHWNDFKTGLGYEIKHVLTEHFGGTVMNRPNSFALEALFRETMPHVLVMAAAFFVVLGITWKATTRWDLFLVLFAGGFSVVLSFCIIPLYRYNLPVIAVLHLMAALALMKCATLLRPPLNWLVLIVGGVLIVSLQSHRCLNYLDQFANDSHVRLRSFVAHNLPAGCSVRADSFAMYPYDDDPRLSENERRLPFRLVSNFWVADLGDYDSLRTAGVDFIAVSENAYGRFFDSHVRSASKNSRYNARRRFYEKLFAEGELVWSSDPEPPTYSFVNPGLRLYRVSGPR